MMKKLLQTLILATLTLSWAHAALKDELLIIDNDMALLDHNISSTTLTAQTLCAPLIKINQEAKAITQAMTQTTHNLTAPISLDNDTLTALESLITRASTLSSSSQLLSAQLNTLQPTTDMGILRDGITATLQLSAEIGTMADRIGAMADKILVMADNIGLMADRILVTQQIQSDNLATTQNTILQTQSNILTIVSIIETDSYNFNINTLIAQGDLLAAKIMATILNPWTMASQMENLKNDTTAFMTDIKNFQNNLKSDLQNNTVYIEELSLASLTNMTHMLMALSAAAETVSGSINALQSITSSRTLEDALKNMFVMVANINTMADAILEMGDTILLMADNIGTQAEQIILMQEAQNANITIVQSAILGIQQMGIGIFASRNLY